jgi:site-specific recombinase
MTLRDVLAHLANTMLSATPDAMPQSRLAVLLADTLRPTAFTSLERGKQAQSNIQALIDLLREEESFRTALHTYICALLDNSYHLALYAESGIQSEQGFFSEAWQKITQFLLPPVHDTRSLRGLVNIIFHKTDDYLWLEQIPDALLAELVLVLGFAQPAPEPTSNTALQPDIHSGTYNKLLDAMLVLSHKITAMAMEPDILNRLPDRRLGTEESAAMRGLAFLEQHREIVRYVDDIRASGIQPSSDTEADNHVIVMLSQCEEAIDYIRRTRDRSGTSLHLTYQMQRIRQHIRRLQTLLALSQSPLLHKKDSLARVMVRLLKEVVRAENTRHSVSAHFKNNTELIALQMSENAAKTGEHYITTTRPEFRAFFVSSLGGGFIVAFLACLKLFTTFGHLPPLIESLIFSLIYAIGFVLIHLLGFKLATKQPAMTASAIAESLDVRKAHNQSASSEERLKGLVRTIACISRSQLVSFAGNLVLALPTAILLASLYSWAFGIPIAPTAKAHKMLAELHPFLSLSLLYAGIAGVFLFTSGLISGYYDNQVVYNHIPERVRRHPLLRRVVSYERREQFARYIDHNLGALAGNFFLGFMLGTAALIGFLTGLPIDIRHITFAAANTGLAIVSLNYDIAWTEVVITLLGVLGIGAVNFIVSFSLALFIALRSRKINFKQGRQLLSLLSRYFRTNTREFFLPPRA